VTINCQSSQPSHDIRETATISSRKIYIYKGQFEIIIIATVSYFQQNAHGRLKPGSTKCSHFANHFG